MLFIHEIISGSAIINAVIEITLINTLMKYFVPVAIIDGVYNNTTYYKNAGIHRQCILAFYPNLIA